MSLETAFYPPIKIITSVSPITCIAHTEEFIYIGCKNQTIYQYNKLQLISSAKNKTINPYKPNTVTISRGTISNIKSIQIQNQKFIYVQFGKELVYFQESSFPNFQPLSFHF